MLLIGRFEYVDEGIFIEHVASEIDLTRPHKHRR